MPNGQGGGKAANSYWKRNLFVIWLSQFLSLAGFGSCMPFIPRVMEEYLGITDRALRLQYISGYYFCGMISLCGAFEGKFCRGGILSASGVCTEYLDTFSGAFLLFVFFRNLQSRPDACCKYCSFGKARLCSRCIEYRSLERSHARLSCRWCHR